MAGGVARSRGAMVFYASAAVAVTGILLVLRRRRRLVGLPLRVRWLLWTTKKGPLPRAPAAEWLQEQQAAKVAEHLRGVHAMTEFERWYSGLTNWLPDFLAETKGTSLEIPVRDGTTVPARAFVNEAASGGWAQTLVLNFHGGGWVFLGSGTHDAVARQLAHRTGAVVVNVDYRLAPGHAYPGPLQDCVDALKYVTSERGVQLLEDALGCRIAASKIFVSGDSAGGNLAACTTLSVRDSGNRGLLQRIAGQILIYPCLSRALIDGGGADSSYNKFAEGYGLTKDDMKWYWYQYTGVDYDDDSPGVEANVEYAALVDTQASVSMRGLPPTLVLLADHDVLKDDGEAYAGKLRAAGVKVETFVVPNTIHGLWDKRSLDKSGQRIFLHAASEFIASRLSNAPPKPTRTSSRKGPLSRHASVS